MVDAQIINYGDERLQAEADEIVLDGISIPAVTLTESYTSRFENKVVFGDYSKDSDQLLSTWVQSNWSGGLLTDRRLEGATDERGRWGKAWTMNAEQLALPPRHERLQFGSAIASGNADARGPISMPLIEIQGVLYVAMGKELWKVTASPHTYSNVLATKVGDLTGYAQGRAVFANPHDDTEFMVPLGGDGVALVHSHTHGATPDTVASTDPAIHALAMEWWDGKQFALTQEGYLRIRFVGSGWDAASDDMRLFSGEQPRNLTVFFNNAGETAIYLVSDRRLWAYDHEVGKIYPSTLTWPKHHNNGLGFTAWRDDALYVSSGLAVTRYTRDGVRTDMGLDRDDGIPSKVLAPVWGAWGAGAPDASLPRPARAITSMVAAQNFIAATVQLGGAVGASGGFPYALCVWNETGWHVLVEDMLPYQEGTGSGRYPTGLYVAEMVGGYRVWWGEGAIEASSTPATAAYDGQPVLHNIGVPRSFHGPRQQVLDNIEAFADDGYYETGWFDAAMEGFQKTWSHLEVNCADPGTGDPFAGAVDVLYRTDDAPGTWSVLGSVTQYGRNVIPFNVDGDGLPRGVTSRAIDFRFEMHTPNAAVSPIISSYILKFIKLALPGRAWQIVVPMDSEQWRGMGPNELAAFMARLSYEGGFYWLMVRDKKFRVRVSQVQRMIPTGPVPYQQIQINLIEVTIPGDPDWGGEA